MKPTVFFRFSRFQALLLLLPLLFLMTSCSERKIEGVNIVGEVNMGFFSSPALLTEICLDNTPYYLLISTVRAGIAGNKSAMAVRYQADGNIPPCTSILDPQAQKYTVERIGITRPNRNVGLVCIQGVSYVFVDEQYSAGMAVHRKASGKVENCPS